MFAALPYRTKNRILLAGALLMLFLSYNLGIKRTIAEISEYLNLEKAAEERNNLSLNPEYLDRRAKALDLLLKNYKVDSLSWRNDFWLKASEIASRNDCQVIYEPVSSPADSTGILNQQVTFSGRFSSLVKALDSLEHTSEFGKVYNLDMHTVKAGYADKSPGSILMAMRVNAIGK